MVDPLSAQQLLAATGGGALLVLFGAFYAFFFSLHRLRPSSNWHFAALGSYAALVASSVVLAHALSLNMAWRLAIGFILVCYYFAPIFIWRLSVATHVEEDSHR